MRYLKPKEKSVLLVLLLLYVVSSLAVNFFNVAVAGVVLSTFTFSLYHSYLQYGIKRTSFFLFICFFVSFIFENLSVKTGFPFGKYYYPESLPGPRIVNVPLLIGLAYFGTGYVSWVLAQIISGGRFANSSRIIKYITLPFMASILMVMWDLCVDPTNSTMGKNWIWENGGAYFGVPLQNFAGWFFTVSLFYFPFSFFISKRPSISSISNKDKFYWSIACYFYLAIGLAQVWPMFFQKYEWINDAAHHAWFTGDIFKSATLIFCFTMLFSGLLALGILNNFINPQNTKD